MVPHTNPFCGFRRGFKTHAFASTDMREFALTKSAHVPEPTANRLSHKSFRVSLFTRESRALVAKGTLFSLLPETGPGHTVLVVALTCWFPTVLIVSADNRHHRIAFPDGLKLPWVHKHAVCSRAEFSVLAQLEGARVPVFRPAVIVRVVVRAVVVRAFVSVFAELIRVTGSAEFPKLPIVIIDLEHVDEFELVKTFVNHHVDALRDEKLLSVPFPFKNTFVNYFAMLWRIVMPRTIIRLPLVS